jgi:hypothetical protein
MSQRNPDDAHMERPRREPEIILPGETHARRPSHVWVSVENGGARRFYIARPGPFTIILALAILGLVAAAMLIVLLSLALIWIPVVIVLIAGFMLSMYWQRFRAWLRRP